MVSRTPGVLWISKVNEGLIVAPSCKLPRPSSDDSKGNFVAKRLRLKARGRVRSALEEMDDRRIVFERQNSSAAWGAKTSYGIKADVWPQAEQELMVWWDKVHRPD